MRWLRSNIRLGTWPALAALALQMVLSFGHVHLNTAHSGAAAVTAAAPGGQGSQSLPAPRPSNNDADDYCAICATIHLAANSSLPQPPQLPVFFASQPLEHFDRVAIAVIVPRRTPFQSRAPPLA